MKYSTQLIPPKPLLYLKEEEMNVCVRTRIFICMQYPLSLIPVGILQTTTKIFHFGLEDFNNCFYSWNVS